jgi:hypothetical protein
MKTIPLTKCAQAIVDDADFATLSRYSWYLSTSGYATRVAGGRKNKIRIRMHRVITECPFGLFVDHINGNKLDNRRANLRIATKQQNGFNRDKQRNNTSGFKGVTWDKARRKWVAQLNISGKHYYLGRFENILDAKKAHDESAAKMHSDFLFQKL